MDRISDCPDDETLAAIAGGQRRLDQDPATQAHVAGCSACQHILAAAAAALEDTVGRDSRESSRSHPPINEVLASKYRIEGELGAGAMGTVYAARHGELGQLVAIKVLHSAAPTAAARFLREAKIAAQLRSEHTARVFDFGRTEDDVPFIVMEHLDGEDLAQLSRRGPLPARRAAEYAIQICSALSEAHGAGVVHRDLKPSNLFVTRRSDGSECIKVLDFGISKLLSEGTSPESHDLTQSQSLLGSPAYMSPEQLRESKDVDARTDIWSLGVVLFELVTGQRPFQATSLPALSAAIAADEPRLPSRFRAAIPPSFERVVLRCLQKEPSARFHSAAQLAAALVRPDEARRPRTLRSWSWLAAAALAFSSVVLAASDRSAPEPSGVVRGRTPLVIPPTPALPTIQCDLRSTAGDPSISFARAEQPSPPERSWSLAAFCASDGSAADELLQAFGMEPFSLRAWFEPALPFHVIEIEWSAVVRAVRVRWTPIEDVALTVDGVACERLSALNLGSSALPFSVRAMRTNDSTPCRFVARLPFEAFGTTLHVQLEPARYTAQNVAFDRLVLSLLVEQKAAKRNGPMQRLVKSLRPVPCVPPEYCWDERATAHSTP